MILSPSQAHTVYRALAALVLHADLVSAGFAFIGDKSFAIAADGVLIKQGDKLESFNSIVDFAIAYQITGA